MNPFDKAWSLLKNMGDDDPAFAAHREEMERLKQQEAQINQQAQATAPKMTPQIQSYQQQLDAKRAKDEQGQRIRAMLKQGRRLKEARAMIEQFYQQHGHYPRRIPKKMMQRLDRLRARDE